jgi:outer membrane protein assembly factor BamB
MASILRSEQRVMSDEDLRELERRAATDAGAALRYARALARSGDIARAARELARVVEMAPSDHEALAELDRLTRGGVDPTSPWPGGRGDGRRSGRSLAPGPVRGGQVSRVPLVDVRLRRGLAVDRNGRVVFVDGSKGLERLLAVDAMGSIEEIGFAGSVQASGPLLLAGMTVVSGPPDVGIRVVGAGVAPIIAPWIAGLGHYVFAKGKQGVEARQLPTRDAPLRWAKPIPRSAAAIALGPGAQVLVLTTSGLGARGSFLRFELATGSPLQNRSLERVGSVDGKIVAASDGSVFLGLGGSTLALDAEGNERWRHGASGFPAALAGPEEEVLLVCEHGTYVPFALDVRTGAELWRSNDACLNDLPKIDASGRVFWRREQELVAFDPRSGAIVLQALVGPGMWDFAFDGKGNALVLNYGTREIVVVE